MAIAVVGRTENPVNATFTLLLCPSFEDGVCACPKDGDGNPSPGHPAYHYDQVPPPHMVANMSAEDWDAATRAHAVGLESGHYVELAAAGPELEPAADPPADGGADAAAA